MYTHYWRTIRDREASCDQIVFNHDQRAKKVVSNSLGLMDFVLNLPDRLVKFF